MEQKQNKENAQSQQDSGSSQKKTVLNAHLQAEKDISEDADLSVHSPNDDLDEEESVKLNADKNGIA